MRRAALALAAVALALGGLSAVQPRASAADGDGPVQIRPGTSLRSTST